VRAMTIYNLYVFDRNGLCVFYREWKREKVAGMERNEEFKLMFGMLLSLRSFAAKLAPRDGKQSVRSFQTSTYKLNLFETPTGLKFAMNTDVSAGGIQELLRQIYSQIYVELVVMNPLVDASKDIDSDLFKTRLDDLVQKHSNFV